MKMKTRILGFLLVSLLSGCIAEDRSDSNAPNPPRDESQNLEVLDKNLDKITANDWDSVYVSRADFDDFLNKLEKEEPSKTLQEIADVEMKNENFKIRLANTEGETLDNLMAAPFIDTWIRQVFLRSAYFDGKQPTVQITDHSGAIIAEYNEGLPNDE